MKSRFIRLFRPIAWITFLLPFSVGLGLGITPKSNSFHIIFSFIAFFSWMIFSFVLNAISDKDVDKLHNGKSKDMDLSFQPLVTGEITEKGALFISMIFLFSSLIFAWLISPFFFILILIIDFFGYIYSMPPLRLKTKPIVDIFCNAISAVTIFVAGLSLGGANMEPLIIIEVFIMASIFYIPTVITDYKFDKKADLSTSAVFFGPKRLLNIMTFLTLFVIIISLIILLFSNLELKVLSILIIIYSVIFTIVSNIKFKEEKLFIHENWILIPFAAISVLFITYGLLKFFGLILL